MFSIQMYYTCYIFIMFVSCVLRFSCFSPHYHLYELDSSVVWSVNTHPTIPGTNHLSCSHPLCNYYSFSPCLKFSLWPAPIQMNLVLSPFYVVNIFLPFEGFDIFFFSLKFFSHIKSIQSCPFKSSMRLKEISYVLLFNLNWPPYLSTHQSVSQDFITFSK